jgi:hypothetical protein
MIDPRYRLCLRSRGVFAPPLSLEGSIHNYVYQPRDGQDVRGLGPNVLEVLEPTWNYRNPLCCLGLSS